MNTVGSVQRAGCSGGSGEREWRFVQRAACSVQREKGKRDEREAGNMQLTTITIRLSLFPFVRLPAPGSPAK